jgi:hypothetical protein
MKRFRDEDEVKEFISSQDQDLPDRKVALRIHLQDAKNFNNPKNIKFNPVDFIKLTFTQRPMQEIDSYEFLHEVVDKVVFDKVNKHLTPCGVMDTELLVVDYYAHIRSNTVRTLASGGLVPVDKEAGFRGLVENTVSNPLALSSKDIILPEYSCEFDVADRGQVRILGVYEGVLGRYLW